jgi:trk system potassium uptake protein TrkH
MVFGLMAAVPLAVSLLFGDFAVGLRYGAVVAGSLLLGWLLSRLPSPRRLQTNEAMTIGALIFLFTPLVTVWPAMASGLGFLDAFFETVSAVTTTGLTVTAALEQKSEAFLFARAWMQWVGGLGIVVLSLALMIRPGLSAKHLGDLEDYEEDLVGGTRAHSRRVLIVYGGLTAVGIGLLALCGTGGFNAALYALAAVSTGGFAPHAASLAAIGKPAAAVAMLLSVAGAVPIVLYHRAYRDDWRVLPHDRQLQGLLVLGLATALVLSFFLVSGGGFAWPGALYHGLLNAFSAQSTAGFSTVDVAGLGPGAKLTLICSMLVGGGSGSTAGGIKILRLLILLRLIWLMVRSTGMPRAAFTPARLNQRRLESEEIRDALCLFLLFILFTVISWIPFVAMGYPPLDALFEVVSAIGTVGLSAGVAAPELHPFLKGVLCCDMLLGRLEILAWLVLVYPGTWIGRRLED